MKKIKEYIKERKIPLVYLAKRMKYTSCYLSQVLGGHKVPSYAFTHFLIFVLKEMSNEKIKEAEKDLKKLELIEKEDYKKNEEKV